MRWKITNPSFESDVLRPWFRNAPWSGHRRFVYDLMVNLEPALTVELGSHFGVSFFAMSQAVKDHSLGGKLVAIDTWQGDEHAGFYGDEVFDQFQHVRTTLFDGVEADIVRARFEEAVESFEDGSIDVLHIDGLHTYEATKRDHELWGSKLKENGIILFHDVAESAGYGTSAYWNEIRVRSDSFAFPHSFGLGVLFPNGVPPEMEGFIEDVSPLRDWYELRSRIDLAELQVIDQEVMIDDRDSVIRSMTAMIDDRDSVIRSMTAMIDDRDSAIRSMTAMIDERDAIIRGLVERENEREGVREASVNRSS